MSTSTLGDKYTLSASVHDDINRLLNSNDTHCVDDGDKKAVLCSKCRRSVHYCCTKLPAYQIQVILTKRTYGYYCQNCVAVPQELLELDSKQNVLELTEETIRLKREIEGCEAIIKKHKENEEELKNTMKSQGHDLKNLEQKLQMSPALLSLEYVNDQLEQKLEDLKECLLTAMKKKSRMSRHMQK